MGAFSLTPSGPFNLTVEVRFTPVVRGPHLIYAREEFVSLEVALRAADELSTAECADVVGISRVSARRYLEHFVARGSASMRLQYGGGGHPERRYRS